MIAEKRKLIPGNEPLCKGCEADLDLHGAITVYIMLIIADTAENDPASSRPKADQLPHSPVKSY